MESVPGREDQASPESGKKREAREFPGAVEVQWLGLRALTARVQFQSLAGELRCQKALPKKNKIKLESQGTERSTQSEGKSRLE